MAFLETGTFVSADEYYDSIHTRVDEREVRPDDLYMMLLRLASHDRAYEAAKWPVRMEEVVRKSSLAVVRFTFLDDNLEPKHETRETMQNGLIGHVEGTIFTTPQSTEEIPVTQAYLKDYFEDQFGPMLEVGFGLTITGQGFQ